MPPNIPFIYLFVLRFAFIRTAIIYCSYYIYRPEEFKLESLDIGQLIKIRVRHDNLNNDGWFLEKVRRI